MYRRETGLYYQTRYVVVGPVTAASRSSFMFYFKNFLDGTEAMYFIVEDI